MKYKKLKDVLKRKDGSYSKRGLWDNIRARDEKGLKNKKPGDKSYPAKDAFKKAQGK